jgi:hypothetical protein
VLAPWRRQGTTGRTDTAADQSARTDATSGDGANPSAGPRAEQSARHCTTTGAATTGCHPERHCADQQYSYECACHGRFSLAYLSIRNASRPKSDADPGIKFRRVVRCSRIGAGTAACSFTFRFTKLPVLAEAVGGEQLVFYGGPTDRSRRRSSKRRNLCAGASPWPS